MSLFGGHSNASKNPEYTQVQLQTSSEGMALPIVYGVARVAPNVIWIDSFRRYGGGGGKGGKGGGGKKGGGGGVQYRAALMLAICEGPIDNVSLAYVNGSPATFASLIMGLYFGTDDQVPFPAIASPGYVPLAYRGVAYTAANAYLLGSSASVPQHALEVVGFLTHLGGDVAVNPADIIYDLCTNARYGLGMLASQIGDLSLYRTYCQEFGILMSPALTTLEQAISIFQRWAELTNTWIFWSENKMKFVPLGDYALGTFTPYTTIQYDLTEDDFCPNSGEPPITVKVGDPSDAYNWVKVNISDRSNQYNTAISEYKDQASIEKYGLFQAKDVQANEICDRSVGATVAGIIGNRALYIRRTYEFSLSYNFVLLEPGDIVSVNDSRIGLVRHPVRIRTIEEDDKGILRIVAEECPAGVGNPAAMGVQNSANVPGPSTSDDPGSVNAPAIIEPPAYVTGGVPQVWIGCSGAVPVWGGADVYLSFDDITYTKVGTVSQATAQGVVFATLPSHADPDTTDTLSIDFSESRQTLTSAVTHADADALRSLVVVNNEVIGYGAVIPNPRNSDSYDLTYLRRGRYSSVIAAAAVGSGAFIVSTDAMLKINLPSAYVGQTLYLKFASFNMLGGGQQDVSTVARYTYTPAGLSYTIAAPTGVSLANSTPSGATTISLTLSWTASVGPSLASYEVQMSSDGGSTWTAVDAAVGSASTSYTLTAATPSLNYQGRVRAISVGGLATSGWAGSGTVNSGAGPSIGGGGGGGSTLLPLVNGDTPLGIMVDPDGVPVYVEQ